MVLEWSCANHKERGWHLHQCVRMCVQGPTNRLLPNPNGFLLDSYGNLMVVLWVPISFIWVLRCWSVLSCVRLRKKDLLLLWVHVCDVFLCMCGCVCVIVCVHV